MKPSLMSANRERASVGTCDVRAVVEPVTDVLSRRLPEHDRKARVVKTRLPGRLSIAKVEGMKDGCHAAP